MNAEFTIVVQTVVADWTMPTLPLSQFPLPPGQKKFRFPGLSPFPIGAQVWIVW